MECNCVCVCVCVCVHVPENLQQFTREERLDSGGRGHLSFNTQDISQEHPSTTSRPPPRAPHIELLSFPKPTRGYDSEVLESDF